MASSGKRLLAFALLLPFASACSIFTPTVKLPAPITNPAWRSASAAELIAEFNRTAGTIQTLTLNLDLTATPAGGSPYSTISGHLLYARPSSVRIYGVVPFIGGRAFDLASDGVKFELSIPSRDQFVVGRNDCIPPETKNPLERLRPEQIVAALPVVPIAADQKVVVLDDVPGQYNLVVESESPNGLRALRRLVFDRIDLSLRAQVVYDAHGERTTMVSYSDYPPAPALQFPYTIILDQPGDYRLQLKLTRPPLFNDANPAYTDRSTFELQRPPGAKLIDAGNCAASTPRSPLQP